MKTLIVIFALAAFAAAKPSGILAPHQLVYSAPFIAPGYISQPLIAHAISSQYHAQDILGQYTYGYASPLSSKTETKTLDGITRGGYSYVDAEGKVQLASYVADPLNGFRVAATNIPIGPTANVAPIELAPKQVGDTPEVAAAKIAHFAAQDEAKARLAAANAIEAAEVKVAAVAPAAVAIAPAAIPLPIGGIPTAPITEFRFNVGPVVETKTAEAAPEKLKAESDSKEEVEVVAVAKTAEVAPAIPAPTINVAGIPTTSIIGPSSYSYTSVVGAPRLVIPSGISTYNAFAAPGLQLVNALPAVAATPVASDAVEVTADAKSAEVKTAEIKLAQPVVATAPGIATVPISLPINYLGGWSLATKK